MNESTGIREKDGQQLSLNYTYWTDLSLAQDMALAIKTQLAEVGIDVTTTGQDQMTWWTEGVAGNYDITTWNTEGSYTEPHKFLQESLGADPHAISLQALEDFQSYSDAVNAFSTSADPEVVQSAIATALNVSNDNVLTFRSPILRIWLYIIPPKSPDILSPACHSSLRSITYSLRNKYNPMSKWRV